MKEAILFPRLYDNMTEGVIAAWHKNVGDAVKRGDLLAEIETDKATMELESYKDGVLLHRACEDGAKLRVNDLLAIIGDKDENINDLLIGTSIDQPIKAKEEIDDTYKISIHKLIYNNTPATVKDFKELLDNNGFYGRYDVLIKDDNKVRLKIFISNGFYMWPFRNDYLLGDNKVKPAKPVFKPHPLLQRLMIKIITSKDAWIGNAKLTPENIYFILRAFSYKMKASKQIIDQLFELNLIHNNEYVLKNEKDAFEFYDNLLNNRLW